MDRSAARLSAVIVLLAATAHAENPNWPPPVSLGQQDLADPKWWPDDGSYSGDWKQWGFFPVVGTTPGAIAYTGVDPATGVPGVAAYEQTAGIGMGFDRAWQLTAGDPHVVIAVIDSGFIWDEGDVVNKWFLNRGELPPPNRTDCVGTDPYDCNGDGIFNIQDYTSATGHQQPTKNTIVDKTLTARTDLGDVNGNGILDPQDLIAVFSDGQDTDGNGFVDDICGWDFLWNDNDAEDDVLNGGQGYSHGHGEANDSSAEGNNGMGQTGTCPNCLVIPIRGSDSFVGDGPGTAAGIEYALLRGASVAQIAQVALSNAPELQQVLDDAYHNGLLVVASGADEGSAHQMMPGNRDHTLLVNGVVYNGTAWNDPTDYTFLNFGSNTNWGGHMDLTASETSAASEATGLIAGEMGLIFSYARQQGLSPALTAPEAYQIAINSAYDIDVPNSTVPDLADGGFSRYASGPGWDSHFSYGRANPRAALEMIGAGRIPPEVDITPAQNPGENSPRWYQVYDPARTTLTAAGQDLPGTMGINVVIDTHGRLDSTGAPVSFDYVVEVGPGLEPRDTFFTTLYSASASGSLVGQAATLDLTTFATNASYTYPDGGEYFMTGPSEFYYPEHYAATIRVRATAHYGGAIGDVRGEYRKTFYVHEDDSVVTGFPIYLGASGESSPKLVDLKHDGGGDSIVLATSDGHLHVFDVTGTEWPGFPVSMTTQPLATAHPGIFGDGGVLPLDTIFATPAIGDLNHDGNTEIVVSTMQGSVHVFNLTGHELPNFPVQMEDAITLPNEVPNAIGLLRKSGQWTIQQPETYGDGGIVVRVDKMDEVERGFMSSPVLYDLFGDGKLEIVQAGMDGFLHVWTPAGTEASGFPVEIRDRTGGPENGYTLTSRTRLVDTPAVGDVFGDGGAEIVLGSNEVYDGISGARLYVINSDGSYAPGWPAKIEGVDVFALPYVGKGIMANPVIANLISDGGPMQIIANPVGSEAFVLDGSGNVLFKTSAELPVAPLMDGGGLTRTSEAAPALLEVASGTVADLDGDGKMEFISATVDALSGLLSASGTRVNVDHQLSAWAIGKTAEQDNGRDPGSRVDANMLYGFPQLVPDYQFLTNFTIADVDDDGLPEVIGGSGMFMITAFNFAGTVPAGWPKFTGAWNMTTPAVGDLRGDGHLEVVQMDRNGTLWAWNTNGSADFKPQWDNYHHDVRNTGNLNTPLEVRKGLGSTSNSTSKSGCGCQGGAEGAPSIALVVLFARRRRR